VLAAGSYPDLVVKTHIVEGPAARCLVRTAQALGASLLVVGARGHGEVTGLLMGSVSENVATHAKCPVVVVRH
jgi:nucleotide-binding universal stress UspA family protein